VLFSLYPGKLIDTLGKWLTPALLAILVVMAVVALLYPSQGISEATGAYVNSAFAEGITQGYMTMDALGSIGFGWVIFRAIQSMGVSQPKAIAKYTLIAAMMYAVAMALVYIALAYIGATSVGSFTNGGDILTTFTTQHFGVFGTLLLGAVMVLACLTTVIGVTTAGSEFYSRTFSKVSYRNSVIVTMVIAALVANIGLEQLLAITLPAVVALHPIAIALLFIAPLKRIISMAGVLATVVTALIFGGLDALHILGSMPAKFDAMLSQHLPLYTYYAGWIVPTVIVLALVSSVSLFTRPALTRAVTES
ncbi:MAG: branched-chain amino acid transport system II carrier protein, partial [Vibrio fluvialis]